MQTRWLKLSVLTALPLLLFGVLLVQKSWQPRTLEIGKSNFKFSFTPDSQRLKVARSADWLAPVLDTRFWDVAHGVVQKTVPNAGQNVAISALAPDDKRLIGMVNDRTLKVWSAATGQVERTFVKPEGQTMG